MADIFEIAGRIHSTSQEGVATVASEILDETQNKKQSEVNVDVARHENEIHGTGGIDSRLSDVEQLAEISIGGGDAQIATGADFTNPDATKRAKVPTVGAIVDGLNDGVYDVSKRNPTAGPNSDGKFTLEYILSNADTLIPTGWRHGGMSIKFVQSSDNKYVQYRLMAHEWSIVESDWQGVDDEPTAGSENLVKSGGVKENFDERDAKILKTVSDIEYYQGGINNDGTKSTAPSRVGIEMFYQYNPINVECSGDVKIAYARKYANKAYDNNNQKFTPSNGVIPFDSDYPYIVIVFERKSDGAANITPEEVAPNVVLNRYSSIEGKVDVLEPKVSTLENKVNEIEDADEHFIITKGITPSTTQIFLKENNYGKNIAIRIVENTSDAVVKAQIRRVSGSPQEFTLSSDWSLFESSIECDRLYIFVNTAATITGTIKIEVVWGDAFISNITVPRGDENIEKQIQKTRDYISLANGVATPFVKNYKAGESTILSLSSRMDVFIPKDSRVTIKGVTISSGLFAETVSNLVLYIIYSTPANEKRSSINYIQNKAGLEILASADIYAFALVAYNSSNEILSAAIDGSITLNIELVYTPVKNGVFVDLLKGGVSLDKRYESGASVSLNQNNRVDIFIPKGNKLKIDYEFSSGLFGTSTISNVVLYILHSKNGVADRTSINYFQNKKGSVIFLEKDVYGFCMAVFDNNSAVLSTTTNGTITYKVGYIYTNAYCGGAVESIGFDSRLDVPSYYFENNYLQNKIKRIKEICANSDVNGDNFVFATDIHWNYNAQHSVGLMKYLFENGALFSKLYLGGDLTQFVSEPNASGYATKEIFSDRIDYVNILNKGIKTPIELAVGNHEYLTLDYQTQGLFSDTKFTNWTNYLHFQNKDFGNGNTERKYYYIDNVDKKIRYIFLASFDQGNEITVSSGRYRMIAKSGYENEQNIWLRDVALNVNSGYKIVIFTHNLCTVSYTHFQNDQTFAMQGNAINIARTLLEYNGNGEVVAVINGHVHRDAIYIINDNSISDVSSGKQIPEIITTCDANDFPIASETMYDRDSETIKEQAFDFVNLDTEKKLIRFIRIGSPANNVGNYHGSLEERNVVYQQYSIAVADNVTLSPFDLTGTMSWDSDDESVATVNNGVVTGVSAGYARITLTTSDNQSVIYMIKVS